MKRRATVVLIAAFILPFALATSVMARAPLVGNMDLQFNLGWPGPQAAVPDWVGTITIDADEYGMAFFAIGSGKSFDSDPSTKVHFFEEIWVIYDGLDYEFDANGVLTEFDPGPVVMSGRDSGITNLVNSKYHMSGSVEEANGAFSMLDGHRVYMSGVIEWYPFDAPRFAPGVLRIS